MNRSATNAPAPLVFVLLTTFLGSVSTGTFWSGTFFLTAKVYGFSAQRNLWLAAAMGLLYIVFALLAGAITRAISPWASPRTLVMSCFAILAGVAIAPLATTDEGLLWCCVLIASAASAVLWPIVESFLSAGRHGKDMRTSIGWFNMAWTSAVALPLLTMPWLTRWHPLASMAVCAPLSLAAAAITWCLPASPGVHQVEASREAIGAGYVALRHATLWMLPLSYVMVATLMPVLPSRLAQLGVAPTVGPLLAATWMVTRFLTLAVLWRSSFWHGRWMALNMAAVALLLGVFMVLLASATWVLGLGLALFGAGLAMIYYGSLYYGLAVGQAAVDAGGTFEALVGVGYLLGPVLGLLGFAVGGRAHAEAVTLTLTWIVAGLAMIGPARAYRKRSGRRDVSDAPGNHRA